MNLFNVMTIAAAPKQKIKYYTTGYSGKDINDLKPMLEKLDAVLVDVWFSPTSQVMRWRQVYLKALLREKYHHLPQLGNRAFQGGRVTIQNLELGIKILTSFWTNSVLMCECADLIACHRLLCAEDLRRRGFETEELETWESEETALFRNSFKYGKSKRNSSYAGEDRAASVPHRRRNIL